MQLRLFDGRFRAIYGGDSPAALGRRTALSSGAVKYIVGTLNGGLLYTGFFMLYDIDIVGISILMFVPYMAALLSIFAPVILERFPKRKGLLLGAKSLYYILSILVITLLPPLIPDKAVLIPVCVVVLLIANVLNCFCQAGFDAWYINFLPEYVKPDHFAFMTLIPALCGQTLALIASFVVDTLSGGAQSVVLIGVRWLMLALGAFDIWICSRPAEVEYRHSVERIRFADIFRIPLSNKKFMGVLGIVCLWTFSYYITQSTLSYYLLNDCKASYTFISGMDMIYPILLFVFQPLWKKYLRKVSWLKAYEASVLIYAVSYLIYGFVNSRTYLPIMLLVRTMQHLAGAGHSITSANLIYLNTPDTDRTGYLSFYNVCTNVSIFLSMLASTVFVGILGDASLTVGSMHFAPVQILLFISGIGQGIAWLIVHCKSEKLTPDNNVLA